MDAFEWQQEEEMMERADEVTEIVSSRCAEIALELNCKAVDDAIYKEFGSTSEVTT